MKCIMSTTYDDKYLYFLPITTWCWNRLGVDVICFAPNPKEDDLKKLLLISQYTPHGKNVLVYFDAPENKKATYAQCSRLFGGSLDLPDDEVLIVGDIDMILFRTDFINKPSRDFFDIYGIDLVPKGQMPMCYAVGDAYTWRRFFSKGGTFQECLNDELGKEPSNEDTRGNLWARDQELLAKGVGELFFGHTRSNGQNQFALNRIDREDSYWRDRLNKEVIDAHLWRPGYTDENYAKIKELLLYFYPDEDFTWLDNFTNAYKELL